MTKPIFLCALLTVAAGVGCETPDAIDPAPVIPVFEVPRPGVAPSDFYALPFPSDIRRDDAGHPIMTDYPTPVGIVGTYTAALPKLDGFGTNAAIFQRFTGAIDVDSLPADAAASLADTASVYLVDVDPDSPEHGQKRPVVFRFQHGKGFTIGADWLSAFSSMFAKRSPAASRMSAIRWSTAAGTNPDGSWRWPSSSVLPRPEMLMMSAYFAA